MFSDISSFIYSVFKEDFPREDFSFKLIKHSAAMGGKASVIGFGRN